MPLLCLVNVVALYAFNSTMNYVETFSLLQIFSSSTQASEGAKYEATASKQIA